MEQKEISNNNIPELNNPAGIPSNHMTEDEFLSLRGVGDAVSGIGMDRYAGANMFHLSNKQRAKALSEISEQSNQYYEVRAKAKEEYKSLVSAGVIVPKTTEEQIITQAHGNPDLEATQAARRMAKKHGIDWETGKALDFARLSDTDIETLWDALADVPFVEDANGALCLDRDWHKYPAGTDRDNIWHDFDKAHSKGVQYLLYERDTENHYDCTPYSFCLYHDLTHIHDSMQFDSYTTTVAEITQNGSVIASIEVIGDVRVDYKGTSYRSYCEFPQELKRLIDNDKCFYDNPDIHIIDNNWFDFYEPDSQRSLVVEVEECSLPMVYKCMAECFNSLMEEKALPEEYNEFSSNGGTILDLTGKNDIDREICVGDEEMENQNTECTGYTFYLYEDLSKVTDSMLIESDTCIAALEQNGEALATLEVRGEVSVQYKGNDYHSVSEFPKDLKTLIEIDPYWFNNPDVYVSMNNWFELFNTSRYNSITVDPEKLSLKEIYELMADGLNAMNRNTTVPTSYDDFISHGGETIDYTQEDLKSKVESLNTLSYYIPELDINGTAEELFIEVRNGYCDKQPEKIAKIAELIENEAQVNNDSELAKKAVIVRAAHELAISNTSNPLNVAQMKYDILVNDKIFDVDGIPLDESGNVVLTVTCDRDAVVFSAYDVYEDGNETVTATGGATIPQEQFLQFSQSDFDATVGNILAYNMVELERTPNEKPLHKKDTVTRD
jgi:hypothetical protein